MSYSHRNLPPQGPPPPPQAAGPGGLPAHSAARLADSLDIVRQEFDLVARDIDHLRGQRDEFETRIHAQINELNHIKQMVYELENQNTKARQEYTEELTRLRQELNQFRQAAAVQAQQVQSITSSAPAPANGPPLPPASTSPHVSHPSGPGYGEPPYGYRRDERDVRDRDMRDVRDARDRDRDMRDVRERDMRERDLRDRDRDRDRERDARDMKRVKTERVDYPPPSSVKYAEAGPPTSIISSTTSAPNSASAGYASMPPAPPSTSTVAFLDEVNPDTLPPEYKREGADWFAVFNPKLKPALDVNLLHTFNHESVVCCVRFSADGKLLATGCNRVAQIYDTKTFQRVCVLNDDTASPVGDLYIRTLCFSPDGKLLATGAEDKTIRIWEIAKRRVKRVFEGHTQEIYSLDFSKSGKVIVSGSGDRTTRIWDMDTGMQKILEINEPDGVDAGVTSVAISPDGRFVAAGSLDTVVRIWEVQTSNLIERLKGHKDSVYSVAFTPDGKGIISGSLDKTLKQWDISQLVNSPSRKEALAPATTPSGGAAAASGVATTPSGAPVGSAVVLARDGGERGSVNTMNFTGHKDYVLSVAVSNDGQWVVSGSKDRGVHFWESRSAQVQLMLQGHKNSVISIDLAATGGTLATGSGDMQARLWSYTPLQ